MKTNMLHVLLWVHMYKGFPGGLAIKKSAGNAEDSGSIPESGRFPRKETSNPFEYSCLENPMDRGAWRAAIHMVAKCQTRLK